MTSWNGLPGSRPPVVLYIGAGHHAPAKTSRPHMTLAMLILFAPPTRTLQNSWPLSPPRPRVQRTPQAVCASPGRLGCVARRVQCRRPQRRQPDEDDADYVTPPAIVVPRTTIVH